MNENLLRDAVKRALDASVPYVTQYGAFMIPSENWAELAGLVSPAVAKLNSLMAKHDRGEPLTEEEVREAMEPDQ